MPFKANTTLTKTIYTYMHIDALFLISIYMHGFEASALGYVTSPKAASNRSDLTQHYRPGQYYPYQIPHWAADPAQDSE